jgi:hypothetical protein
MTPFHDDDSDADATANIDPYFLAKPSGPFEGWSTHALDNLKDQLPPMDFSRFIADRHITYRANQMGGSGPAAQCKCDYDPADYGQPVGLHAQIAGKRGLGRTDAGLGLAPSEAAFDPSPIQAGANTDDADFGTDPAPHIQAWLDSITQLPPDHDQTMQQAFDAYRALQGGFTLLDGERAGRDMENSRSQKLLGDSGLLNSSADGEMTGKPIVCYLQADQSRLGNKVNKTTDVDNNQIDLHNRQGLLTNVIDYGRDFGGGAEDLYRNYQDMRTANTIGADKYFHCLGHCQASRRGPGGRDASEIIGEGRELFDEYIKGDSHAECDADREANKTGRDGDPPKSCDQVCQPLRPRGLNQKY